MKIGFIGAGRVGFTLGKYFQDHGKIVSGYYSHNPRSAKEASEFTKTRCFRTLEQVVDTSDVLFLTVPDGQIAPVWDMLKQYKLEGKIVCHCSGAISSAVFSEIDQVQAFGYSIHPLFAVSSKLTSNQQLSNAYFTIEGSPEKLALMKELIESMGNPVGIIDASKKVLYHAAAALISNHLTGLIWLAVGLMEKCGFDEDFSGKALLPLMLGQCENVARKGAVDALTGAVERNDFTTVQRHLEALTDNDTREIYRLLSLKLLEISEEKHPGRDYTAMRTQLKGIGGKQ